MNFILENWVAGGLKSKLPIRPYPKQIVSWLLANDIQWTVNEVQNPRCWENRTNYWPENKFLGFEHSNSVTEDDIV